MNSNHSSGLDAEALRVRRFFLLFTGVFVALAVISMSVAGSRPFQNIGQFFLLPAGVTVVVFALAMLVLWKLIRISSFLAHALATLVALLALNWMIAHDVPLQIKQLGSSYLIFFYHFPAAINCFLFYTMLMVFSVLYLKSEDPLWDRCGRVAAEIGLLATSVVLVTGSTWAKAAWGHWWVWDDKRLMTVAIMWLIYAGYMMLQKQMDDAERRRRFAAVFGILAFLNLPLVHFAVSWFGEVSHPPSFEELAGEGVQIITITRWYGVLAFLCLYALLYRWKLAREGLQERLQAALAEARRLEEGGLA
ncbi:MAG: cytochrome c biogenesis protein [Planctomycetota bacterium]